MNIAIFASHGGSNAQAIIDACAEDRLAAAVAAVISNNSQSGALDRARRAGIPSYHLSSKAYPEEEALDRAILETLRRHGVNLIALAGYMKKLGPETLRAYAGRILNVHPSLLPKFGGHGMYGEHVHEAVIAAGERETGVTVHLVDAEYDEGPIVAQCAVPVEAGDTAETLAERVLHKEHEFYVATLQRIARGEIVLPG
ncbi:phosphoribosylglycinamide formyltransferase [Paenibacillus ginsengarvi]|uniref:Phosphoribosylglycinamide formyltransferase n=1 Tax=Paenibacillus ginsengarvi TaxID=400777 RepID=A0A3B0CKM7_9BACL|nr:phosphoribosylglycinamide formyltransferase [Paenibacillus ginsengarvi]RKN85084.1 phosphoribosylglycinamide formyltransferase [Paenibacillus ginsengarvi]